MKRLLHRLFHQNSVIYFDGGTYCYACHNYYTYNQRSAL